MKADVGVGVREAMLRLADNLELRADAARKNTRAYDGGGWEMKAEAYDFVADEIRDALRSCGINVDTEGAES